MQEFRKILIVQTAFIGDVILVTPLIRAAAQLYPKARIDALVTPITAPLLHNNPNLNKVICFDKKRKRWQLPLLALKLRREHYDLALSPHSSFTTHLLLWLAGIGIRVGYERGFLSGLLLSIRVPHPKGIHKIRKNLCLLKPLTLRSFEIQTELFPDSRNEQHAEALIDEAGMQNSLIIAIAPGSIWKTKCWPLEHYCELALGLANRGFGLVLIGGKEDIAICDQLEQCLRKHDSKAVVLNAAGRSDLLTSAALLAKADLLICNDSGALHIANAVKTRVFAIFGPTVQSIGYFPYREGDIVFETELACRPCGSHGGERCPLGHHDCMNLVKPQRILEQIDRLRR